MNEGTLNEGRDERDPKDRCSTAIGHLRLAWYELRDAGVQEQFKARMMEIASDIKLALGNEEADGFDKPTPTGK